jgi:uncharacterized membrane-anchored protein
MRSAGEQITMFKSSVALIGALALALTATAFADIPPPRPDEPQPRDSSTTVPPGPEQTAPAPSDGRTTPAPTKEEAEFAAKEAIAKSLVKREGLIALPGGQATVNVGEGFAYLDTADSEKLLTQIWGNPPSAVGHVIGIIMPRDVGPLEAKSWAAVLTYDNDGHVSDSDASSINYDDTLKEMQDAIVQDNSERIKAGYEPIVLIGWAQKPSYDAKEHKLYWAKHLRFGRDGDTLNYAIRALGRTGVLQVNIVGDMRQLDEINGEVPKLLSMISFTEGNRYAEFNESTDPVAAYGLAALVAGGVAAKAGFFKGLLIAAAAAWKLIAVAVVAIGALLMRFFRKSGPPPETT